MGRRLTIKVMFCIHLTWLTSRRGKLQQGRHMAGNGRDVGECQRTFDGYKWTLFSSEISEREQWLWYCHTDFLMCSFLKRMKTLQCRGLIGVISSG